MRVRVPALCRAALGSRWCAPIGYSEPLARQRLPLRADLLGLCARSARAPWRDGRRRARGRAASAAAIPGARAASTRPGGAAAASSRALLGGPRARPVASDPDPHHDRHSPHHALGGVLRLAVPDLGRLEQAQRPAVVLRSAARRARARRRRHRAGTTSPAPAARHALPGAACPAARSPAPRVDRRGPAGRGRGVGRAAREREGHGLDRSGPRHDRQRRREIDRLELLKHVDQFDRAKNVVLFDRSASRLYVAQTGLVPAAGGTGPAEPPHAR